MDDSTFEEFLVGNCETPPRIDKWLTEQFPEQSRSVIQDWLYRNLVWVNGRLAKKNKTLHNNDIVKLFATPEAPPTDIIPEDIPLNIVWEDDEMMVIHKPKQLVVHPGNGIYRGTLANAVVFHCANITRANGNMRPGIVHRLDRDTSGLMVVAKTDFALNHLSNQLRERTLKRVYHAFVWGTFDEESGTVNRPLGRDPQNRLRQRIYRDGTGREAITHYIVKEKFKFASLVELKLQTGRTHQIRVHMDSLHHPIIGDGMYHGREHAIQKLEPIYKGKGKELLELANSQALQAVQIGFIHPRTLEYMEFKVGYDIEMQQLIDSLSQET
jgi:23S rRNA pseudouridine1911/1915/1917 synthase